MGQSCPTEDGVVAPQTCSNNFIPLTSLPRSDPAPNAKNLHGSLPIEQANLAIFGVRIEKRLGSDEYRAWFRNVRFVEFSNGKIVLSAETRLIKSRIEQQYEWQVVECFRPEYPDAQRVHVILRRPEC
jgi:hypothetical protein